MTQNKRQNAKQAPEVQGLRIREIKRLLNLKDMKDAQGARLSAADYKKVRRELLDELGALEHCNPLVSSLLADLFEVAVCLAEDVHPDDISAHERMVLQKVADFLNINLDKLLPTR